MVMIYFERRNNRFLHFAHLVLSRKFLVSFGWWRGLSPHPGDHKVAPTQKGVYALTGTDAFLVKNLALSGRVPRSGFFKKRQKLCLNLLKGKWNFSSYGLFVPEKYDDIKSSRYVGLV